MKSEIHRRIVNAKFVFERAVKSQQEDSEMSQGIAVLLLHDAAELLMIVILDHLKINVPKKREFMDFWGAVKQSGRPEPPDKAAMEALNTIRVSFKHKGITPNPKEVLDCVTRTRGFFENVLATYCDISFSDVSLIDLVPDELVRSMLRDAQRKFKAGDKDHAIADLRLIFDSMERRSSIALIAPRAPQIPAEMRRAGWETYLNSLHTFLHQSAKFTTMLTFGVDPGRYLEFVRYVPSIQYSHGSEYTIVYTGVRLDTE